MSPGLQTFPQCCTCAFQLRMPLKAITHPSSGSGICWQWSVHLCLHAGQLGLQITCFNFQTVQITWDAGETSGSNLTFMYRFQDDPAYVQCLHYSIHGSHTNGCLLSTAGDDILHFVLLNGSHALINRSQWLSDHLKPGSPRDVSFQWEEEAVTVSCVQLPYSGILYEVQHRSTFDTEWQSQDAETCNVTIHGLDPDKCYRFRVRARTKLSVYGPEAQPSEWSAISHWKRARPKVSRNFSCPLCQTPDPASPGSSSATEEISRSGSLTPRMWHLRIQWKTVPRSTHWSSTCPGWTPRRCLGHPTRGTLKLGSRKPLWTPPGSLAPHRKAPAWKPWHSPNSHWQTHTMW
ncbi:cytokine receptor-like factor 2 isoform X5 [Oryctolagus cuniculus]|uniref:cytokine receptor-like factor 2 isoform X5 n=1 Tax=Oryctolagus cuniculus TaxID=9986 RepID=UPI0038797B95